MNEVKKTVDYEIGTGLSVLKQTSTWLNFFSIVALLSVLVKEYVIAAVLLVVVIILKFRIDFQSGEVIKYYREQRGIPTKTQITKMKLEAKKKEKENK